MSCVVFMQFIRKEYKDYKEDKQNQILVFDEDQVRLDLPTEKVKDWTIQPLTYPQVDTTCLTIMITCIFPL